MPECTNCVRLRKRNRQWSNQLITAQTKDRKSAKEMKALKKQFEKNLSGIFYVYLFFLYLLQSKAKDNVDDHDHKSCSLSLKTVFYLCIIKKHSARLLINNYIVSWRLTKCRK